MPRPRAGDWLCDEIHGWKQAGIDTVVSLLENHEVRELGLTDESALCKTCEIAFLSFPIPDRGTPASVPATVTLLNALIGQLRQGKAVALHCRAGIGRTGVLGACILLNLGVPSANVFALLSRARTLPMPDTKAQVEWVARFERESLRA
jgi:protein-tyrosine phosphatase